MSNSTVSELASLDGLENAKKAILQLAQPESRVQSVLLYGARGSGAETLARLLTQAWLCTKAGTDGACGVCQACSAFLRSRSADFLHAEPVGPSRMIKMAHLMEVKSPQADDPPTKIFDFIRTMPLTARSRVVWIRDAERMNSSVGNALLKRLEEPPADARFILTTTAVGSLLPTILSRCLAIACELPAGSNSQDLLELAGGGVPGRVEELRRAESQVRSIAELATKLPRLERASALETADRFAALADALQEATGVNARTADSEALEILANVYGQLPEHRPEYLLQMVEAHRRIIGNGSPGLIFDALFCAILS